MILGLAGVLMVLSLALRASEGSAATPFTTPSVVTGDDAGEPGIDIASDGTLYINAPVGFLSSLPGSASWLFKSDDHGASWFKTDPGLRAVMPGGGDSDVAIDPVDGTLYFSDLYLVDSTVSVSHDKAQSWASTSPIGGLPVHDRQWLATAGRGMVYHVYNQIPAGLVVSKSFDGGLTFLQHTIAATVLNRGGCICPPGNMISESFNNSLLGIADNVGVIYATSSGGIGFARSSNGGLIWSRSVISADGSADNTAMSFPVVANAGGSKLKAVWMEEAAGTTRIRFSRSADWGKTWSAPVTIVNGGTSLYPWLDAKGNKVSVVLYHTNDSTSTPGGVPASALWYAKYMESLDGGSSWSQLSTLDYQAVKSGPVCTEGASCQEDRELLDFLQVAIDPQNRANATWTRSIDNAADTEIRFSRQQY